MLAAGALPLGTVKDKAMKKVRFNLSDFNVGDRVIQPENYGDRFNPDEEVYGGTVEAIEPNGVRVIWDKKWMNTDYSLVPVTDVLYLETDWNAKQSVLETEFNKVASELKAKLETVKQSLLDAQKIVSDAGYEFYDFRNYDAMSPLETALGQFGWSTSSLYC